MSSIRTLPSYDDSNEDEAMNLPGQPEKRLWKSVIARAYSDIIYFYAALTDPTSGIYMPTVQEDLDKEALNSFRHARVHALSAFNWFMSDKFAPGSFTWCITYAYNTPYHESLINTCRTKILPYKTPIQDPDRFRTLNLPAPPRLHPFLS